MAMTREEVLRECFDEEWQTINPEIGEKYGWPTWITPRLYRQEIENAFCEEPAVGRYDPRDRSDRHILSASFRRVALPMAEIALAEFLSVVTNLPEPTYNRLRRKLNVKGVPRKTAKRPPQYQKADARNLELLAFVVERIIPFAQLLKPCPGKGGKDTRLLPGHRGPKVAVPREYLCREWNRTHPHDPMSSGDTLMRKFHRAAKQPHLCGQFLFQVKAEIDEEWNEQANALREIRESIANLPEEQRAKFAAPAKISAQQKAEFDRLRENLRAATATAKATFSSREEYEEWRAKEDAKRAQEYRDALTRKDLIEKRVLPLVWRLSTPKYRDDEATERLEQTPLREWFLPEARGAPVRLRWSERGELHRRKAADART